MAPNCLIMPIKIPFQSFDPEEDEELVETYASAIMFAKNHPTQNELASKGIYNRGYDGCDVISNSWTFEGLTRIHSEFFAIIDSVLADVTTQGRPISSPARGCVVVFAAGNNANHYYSEDGQVEYPADSEVSGVLTVAASNREDEQANYSPSDLDIDVAAPSAHEFRAGIKDVLGEDHEIWTIDLPDQAGYNPDKEEDPDVYMPSSGTNYLSYTGRFSGTSAACPVVAGIAALLLSYDPYLTQQEVFDLITNTAEQVGGYNYDVYGTGKSEEFGYGRVNASRALSELVYDTPASQIVVERPVSQSNTVNLVGVFDSLDEALIAATDAGDTVTVTGDITITADLEIESGKIVKVMPNVSIRFDSGSGLIVNGTLIVDGCIFTRSSDTGDWDGITIDSSGTLIVKQGMTIEHAEIGLSIFSGDGDIYGDTVSTIKNCGQGVYVNGCSPWIRKVKFQSITNEAIYLTGSATAVNIYYNTIDGAANAIYNTSGADAYLKYSNLKNTSDHSVYLDSGCFIDMSWAQDNIYPADGKYAIDNTNSLLTLSVYNTYWGESTPDPTELFGVYTRVSYSPMASSEFTNGAPAKIAGSAQIAQNPLNEAIDIEGNGHWREALQLYNTFIATSADLPKKRMAIKSILRICEDQKLDFADLRNTIFTELTSVEGWYKQSLDLILCELLVKEGKYIDAIQSFSIIAEENKGTPAEVEIFARIAVIYGRMLKDKGNAKVFADKAAVLNPGQECLTIAYASAGISYNPRNYTNKFESKLQPDDSRPEIWSAPVEDSVTVNPNPANPVTTITYTLKNASQVKLTIYAMNGQKIATLADGPMSSGTHSAIFNGAKYASGVYFYRFESDRLKKNGKLLLL
jgi:hypothetical protein